MFTLIQEILRIQKLCSLRNHFFHASSYSTVFNIYTQDSNHNQVSQSLNLGYLLLGTY